MSLAVQSRKKNNLKSNTSSFKTPKRFVNGNVDNKILVKNKNYLSNSSKYSKNMDQLSELNKIRKFDDDRKIEVKKELMDEKNDAREDANQSNDLMIELGLNNLSHEDLKQREKYFDDKLKDLEEKLTRIRGMGFCSDQALSDLKENEMKDSLKLFVKEYLSEVEKLERDCNDKLESLNEWYSREKGEIEETFRIEKRKASQEFSDKRKELKENLINEHEEVRKQIEIDRNTLDINMDSTEVKPPPTRNLRRRTNHNNTENDTSAHELSSSHIGLHVSSSVTSNSTLLQSNSVNLTSTSNLSANNIIGSCPVSYFSLQSNLYSSSSYSQYVNDRKRRINPNMMFQLGDDDLNDDLKYLSKSLRVSNCHSPCKN